MTTNVPTNPAITTDTAIEEATMFTCTDDTVETSTEIGLTDTETTSVKIKEEEYFVRTNVSTNPAITTDTGIPVGATMFTCTDDNVETLTEVGLADTETTSVKIQEVEVPNEVAMEVMDSSSYSCTCIACTANKCEDASSEVVAISLCPLYKRGCRHCYDLCYNHFRKQSSNMNNNITLSDTIQRTAASTKTTTTTSKRICLFRCCMQESREVRDQYALTLDRVLSLLLTKTSTVPSTSSHNRIHGTLQTQPTQILSIGTVVLCCWHLNGRRYWGSVFKTHRCARHHWNQSTDSTVYSIRFYDGRIRHNVQRSEFLCINNGESDIWNEQIRLLHGENVSNLMRKEYYEHRTAINTYFADRRAHSRSQRKRLLPSMNETPTDNKRDYYQQRKSKRLSRRLTFQELFYHRCRACQLCRLPDCGVCESCRTNCTTTSTHRLVCIINMCTKLPITTKRQNALYGWNYYFDTPSTQRSASINTLHPPYQRLRLIAPSSTALNQNGDDPKVKSFSILTALHELPSDECRIEFGAFFEALIGCPLNEPCAHTLVSKGYIHEYCNIHGTANTILSGSITKCWKHFIHRTISFTVKFDKRLSGADKVAASLSEVNGDDFVIEDTVPEQVAWGGFQKFCLQQHAMLDKNLDVKIPLVFPYSVDWMVPSKRYMVDSCNQRLPYLILEFRNTKLQFEAKTSTISGAGLGLFVKSINGQGLSLQPGEMLDLGIYAPLRVRDIKSKHISMVKNLIYDWSVERWSFASKSKNTEECIYDPTDDFTGTRHHQAKRNMISYINEICQNDDIANVTAQHDPEGNVHYLLGHWEEREGEFVVSSCGKPLELMIDYGPVYERCRLRNGYSRSSAVCPVHKSIIKSEDDAATIEDFSHFSYNQLKDCVDFLHELYSNICSDDERRNHTMALVAAFALEDRLKDIIAEFDGFNLTNDEFCDDGVSTMITTAVKGKLKMVVTRILMKFHGRSLTFSMKSMKLLKNAVMIRISVDMLDTSCRRDVAKDLLLDLYQ